MRAAAILGPGNVSRAMAQFQRLTGAEWTSLLEQADVAVIFGGDGTIHLHLSELVELETPLLVVPCGSGNDFARALGINSERDSAQAFRQFGSGQSNLRTIDLGLICDVKSSTQRYFCCVAGVGIDGAIAARSNRLPSWLRGRGGYFLSAPPEFIRFAPLPMKVSMNGTQSASQPTLLAAVANAPAYGGGMKIAPHAQLSDGKLDLCVVRGMNVFKLFCLFPTVYFGRHLRFKEVEYSQTDSVRIETEYPIDVYADGELVCKTPVTFGVARGVLKVLTLI
ncbi:MAG TPA: diacylglycerol kinase family protein [Terriglobales bacterium]|nr:diacylglycerol kinase family protein [Terriglobales bacterium]